MEFRIAETFTGGLARLTGDEQKAVKTTRAAVKEAGIPFKVLGELSKPPPDRSQSAPCTLPKD